MNSRQHSFCVTGFPRPRRIDGVANRTRARMDVTLSPEAEKLVREKLESGEYDSVSEVLEDALRALEVWRVRDYEQTVEGIRRGLESVNRGEGRPAKKFFDEMRQKHGIPR